MTYLRRKLRQQSEEQIEERGETPERVSPYSLKNEAAAPEGGVGAPPQPAVETEPEAGEAPAPADVASVGEEVGTVLKSAQEAAARIRATATGEAERVRNDAETAAAAALEEARRIAEAERAEGARVRAEAEAYASEVRAAAEEFADERRAEAEREAAKIISDAQRRLTDADADVEQKLRQATARERQHIEALQGEVAHYEERLDSILVVFRGVTSQLEDLLAKRQHERSDGHDVADEALEDALRPDPSRLA